MKKVMMNTRVLAIALVASFTVALASPALANGEKNEEKKVIPVEMKFAGTIQDQPLFYLVFNNQVEQQFTITVRDEQGDVLYRETIKAGKITKKFMLNTEDLGNSTVKFEIAGKNYENPVVFEVNKQSRLVEDVVVNKLK
jgi:hypothetical protein